MLELKLTHCLRTEACVINIKSNFWGLGEEVGTKNDVKELQVIPGKKR